MNYIPEIAKLFGVEVGEEFYIKGNDNKFKITNRGMCYSFKSCDMWAPVSWVLCDILNGKLEIIKKPKPILDEAEKKYLSNVIKPFRNQVKYIEKNLGTDQYDNQYEFIRFYLISVKANSSDEILDFPYYKADTMYKGMELGKQYSVDDPEL